jgi:phage tail-like protein
MPVGVRIDPLPAFHFLVQLIEPNGLVRTVAGFSECTGLDSTLEIHEYQEGGVNDRVHKFPTRFTFSNIVLRRGVTIDPTLRAWHDDLLRGNTARRDGLIVLLDERRLPVLAWRFSGGLPAKWTGPGLNASASEVSVESLEIAVERLEPFGLGAI